MFTQPKDIVFAPVYFYQSKLIKQKVTYLPEPAGQRQGKLSLNSNKEKNCYQFMIVGDSSAAGVGVEHQNQALMGQVLDQLSQEPSMIQRYHTIDWQLHATTGHDSFDVLRRLYLLPKSLKPIDVLTIVIGVNDVTKMQSVKTWQRNLDEILAITDRKFKPKKIIFTAIPPMEEFPALPYPLSSFIGVKADKLRAVMQSHCENFDNVQYVDFEFLIANIGNRSAKEFFACDGIHPNESTYSLWAEQLVKSIIDSDKSINKPHP